MNFPSPLPHKRPHLTFLTGPTRSGKSQHAINLASEWSPNAVFVATYRPLAGDLEMEERIRKHREKRPSWRVLEAPKNPADSLLALNPAPSGAIIDSLTLWASDQSLPNDHDVETAWMRQLDCFRAFPWPTIIVGDEVGWALVPTDPALRRFRDLVGLLNQRTAAAADEAWLFVAGCPVRLK